MLWLVSLGCCDVARGLDIPPSALSRFDGTNGGAAGGTIPRSELPGFGGPLSALFTAWNPTAFAVAFTRLSAALSHPAVIAREAMLVAASLPIAALPPPAAALMSALPRGSLSMGRSNFAVRAAASCCFVGAGLDDGASPMLEAPAFDDIPPSPFQSTSSDDRAGSFALDARGGSSLDASSS